MAIAFSWKWKFTDDGLTIQNEYLMNHRIVFDEGTMGSNLDNFRRALKNVKTDTLLPFIRALCDEIHRLETEAKTK